MDTSPVPVLAGIRSTAAAILLAAALPLAMAAAEAGDGPFPAIAMSAWGAGTGITACAASADGSLAISYRAAEGGPARIVPERPVPLPGDIARLSLWFAWTAGDGDLVVELQDAAGRRWKAACLTSRMTSDAVFWNQARRRSWSTWNRAETTWLRTPPEAEITARLAPGDHARVLGERWTGPLSLTAIEIHPAATPRWHCVGDEGAVRRREGTVVLQDLRAERQDGFQADTYWYLSDRLRRGRQGGAVLFPDDLCEQAVPFRYRVEVHDGYQGPVVAALAGEARPGDAGRRFAQRIALPRLPEGRYFLAARAWGAEDGRLLNDIPLLQLWIVQERRPDALEPPAAAGGWSAGGRRHVLPAGTRSADLGFQPPPRPPAPAAPDAVWRFAVQEADGRRLQAAAVPAGEGSFRLACPVEDGHDYFAVAELAAGDGAVRDRHWLHFGVATPVPQERPAAAAPRQPTDIRGRSDIVGEYWYGSRSRTYPWLQNLDLGALERWMALCAGSGCRTFAVGDTWSSHEVLPGVFQWEEARRQIRLAERHGMGVQFGYSADGTAMQNAPEPLWVGAALARDQRGDVPLRIAPGLSAWDPAVRAGRIAYYRALAAEFAGDPALVGYRIRPCLLPAPGYGASGDSSRFDYSAPAQAAFATWADSRGGGGGRVLAPLLTVPGLSDRDLGTDLSEGWRAAMDFASYAIRTSIADLLQAIRATDPIRYVCVDQKPFPHAIEAAIPLLRDGGMLKNEDSPAFGAVALRSMCAQAGVPYVEELHNHLPTSRSIADATDFWGSYHALALHWLIRGRPELIAEVARDPEPGAWDQRTDPSQMAFLRDSRPVWEAWIRCRAAAPAAVVVGSRIQGLVSNRRMGAEYDLGGLDAYQALLASHQIPCHFATEHCTWVDLRRFRLVVVAAEVMTAAAIQQVLDASAAGARIVLVGDAGRICADRADWHGHLARSLSGSAALRTLPPPARVPAGGRTGDGHLAFPDDAIDGILAWAGIERPARAIGPAGDRAGFEIQVRHAADGAVLVAVMRRWTGWYHGAIEREGELLARFGTAACRIEVRGLAPGPLRIAKLHRDRRVGDGEVGADGVLSFDADPARAGEVQIFRLERP